MKANFLFHRKGAKDAGSEYFLFAFERPANKKTQALRANQNFELKIASLQTTLC